MLYEEVLNRESLRIYLSGKYDPDTVDPEHSVLLKALGGAIREGLTGRQREILLLYYYRGMTMKEIASMLGLNKSTVSRHISRAMNKIRKTLLCFMG